MSSLSTLLSWRTWNALLWLIKHSTKRSILNDKSTFDAVILTSTMRQAFLVETTSTEYSCKRLSSFISPIEEFPIFAAISLKPLPGLCSVSLTSVKEYRTFSVVLVWVFIYNLISVYKIYFIKIKTKIYIPFPSIFKLDFPFIWSTKVIAILQFSPCWFITKVFGARWTAFRDENLFSCPNWLQTMVSVASSDDMCCIEFLKPIWLLTVALPGKYFILMYY